MISEPAAFFSTVAGALLLAGLAMAARRRMRSAGGRVAAASVAAISPAFAAATAAAAGWPQSAWAPPLILSAAMALVLIGRSPAAHGLYASVRTRKQAAAGLGAGALAVGLWWASGPGPGRPEPAPGVENSEEQRAAALASIREMSSPVALTDRGRLVRLHAMPESALPSSLLAAMDAGAAEEWGPTLKVIRTGPADRRSDCHGWVFADGGWWVVGTDVNLVLKDNGYVAVDSPAAGDLVVYRDARGEITHSGLVWAVARSGDLLIESKWAWLGTHLHAPNDHPYGGTPTYYRSPRAGHRLKLVDHGTQPVRPQPASDSPNGRPRPSSRTVWPTAN